ncbi:MAG: hypothetical protein WC682_02555 [Parcubacteria group bacterium]|jgi:hypothetical protein
MIKDKKIIIPAVALAILMGVGAYGIGNIYASEDNDPKSIVEKIADKFNLSKDDVQKVFDEDRSVRVKEMETRFENMLNKAVSDGKLTEAQKKIILDKKAEIRSGFESNRENMRNLSREEMESKIKSERESLEKWASDNGIDMQYLMGMGGYGRGGHGPNGLRWK